MKTFKKILFAIFPFLIMNCSGSGTTINLNEENDLNKYEKIYWGVSKSDSVIDFRKINNGFATLKDSLVVETINKDSVKVYKLSQFKTIYVDDGLNFIRYSVTGLIVIITILGIYLLPKSAD